MGIIPFQCKFDKDFPVVIGNAEYNAECELLKAMDIVIATSGMEETFIKYGLDVACVNKAISLFGTGKSPRLTAKEIETIRENAIFALRASILRKHLRLPLRRFVLALSHSDLPYPCIAETRKKSRILYVSIRYFFLDKEQARL